MKKNLLLATLLVSAAFGLGATNRAMATDYTIDGSADYLSGAADGTLGASQLTVDGTTPISGTWNKDAGDKITMNGGTLTIQGYNTESGDELTNGILEATGGTVNVTGGTFDATGSSFSGNVQFTNAGTVTGTPTSMALDKLTNSGSINIGTAQLTLNALESESVNSGLINAGGITIGAGHTFRTAGVNDTTNPTSGLNSAVTNNGTLELTGGIVAQNINSFAADLNGTVNLTGNVSVADNKGIYADTLALGSNTLTLGANSEAAADTITVNNGTITGGTGSILTVGNTGLDNDITNATIAVDKVYAYGNVAADASKITTNSDYGVLVESGSTVTLTGAMNENKFRKDENGTNTSVIIAESMANTGLISTDNLTVNNGITLTTNADKLATQNAAVNNGTIKLTGGTSDSYNALGTGISGTNGKTYIGDNSNNAYVSVAKAISQEVEVYNKGHLNIASNGSTVDLTVDEGGEAKLLTGGTVNGDVENNGLFTFSGGTLNGNYTQSATGKSVFNSDTTFNAGSQISGGEMELVASDVVFNNGVDNNAKILMTQDDGSSLSIIGLDADHVTTLTLNEDSNLAYGSLTVGDALRANELNVTANSQIAQAVLVDLEANSEINLSGSTASLVMDTADTWAGAINQTAGTLTVLGTVAAPKKTGELVSDGGSLVIGDATDPNNFGSLTLANQNDSVTANTVVVINNNGQLEISDGSVVLDNNNNAHTNDTWNGAIVLNNSGELTLDGRYEIDTTNNVKTYNQYDGTLNMNHSTLALNTSDSGIFGGTVNMDNVSSLTFNNGSTQNMAEIISAGDGINKLILAETEGLELHLTGDSYFAEKDQITVGAGSLLSIESTSANGVALNGGANGDTWNGHVIVAEDGILNISGNIAKADGATLTQTSGGITNVLNNFSIVNGDVISSGNLNIGNNTVLSQLNVNGATIGVNTAVNIDASGTLYVQDGPVALNATQTSQTSLDQADTWTGTVTNAGSTQLTLDGFSGENHKNGVFTQTAGTTTVTHGFDMNNQNDSISGGTFNVNTGDLNVTAGEISDGTVTVAIGNLTVGGGDATQGVDGGIVSGGDITVTAGDMTVSGNGLVGADANLTITAGDLNITGGTVNYGGANDSVVAGVIDQTDGVLNIVDSTSTTLDVTGGEFNILSNGTADDTVLTVGDGSSIVAGAANATVYIAQGTTLLINGTGDNGGSVTLDGGENLSSVHWDGTVQLEEGGSLVLANIVDQSRVDGQTPSNKTGTLIANAGNLSIDNTTVLLGNQDYIDEDVNLTLTGNLAVQDGAEATVDNGDAWTSGTINLNDGGDLTLIGVDTDTNTNINVVDGDLTLTNGVDEDSNPVGITLGNTNDNIDFLAHVDLDGDLVINDGNVELNKIAGTYGDDSIDSLVGSITQNGGTLSLLGVETSDDLSLTINGGETNLDGMTFGNENDFVGYDAQLNIANGLTINDGHIQLNGTDYNNPDIVDPEPNDVDTLTSGTITLNGGQLDLMGISTNDNVNLDADGGTLTINNGVDGDENVVGVTLNNELDDIASAVAVTINGDLTINNGTVRLEGDNDTLTQGTITLNDGQLDLTSIATVADIPAGDDPDLNPAVPGVNLVADGGDLNLYGVTLNNAADSIAYAVETTMDGDLTINAGHVQLDGDTDVLTSGTIGLNGGTLDLMAISTNDDVNLNAETGNLNIQTGETSLVNDADAIAEAVVVAIDGDATLTIDNEGEDNLVVLNLLGSEDDADGHDTWAGTVNLVDGNLEILDSVATTGDTVGTYTQTGGELTLTDSAFTLAEAGSFIDGDDATVNINGTENGVGSDLTFDNGRTGNDINQAIIVSDDNAGNSLTVGGANGAELTLLSGSDINANTDVIITANGILNASGDSIKGDNTVENPTIIQNDGVFNLTNVNAVDPVTGDPVVVPGTIARAINNAAGDGSTGTVNLLGETLSTEGSTIDQAFMNVGDENGTPTTFAMGDDVTINDTLTVFNGAEIENAASELFAADLEVEAGGSIVGDEDGNEGNITIGGGTNAGEISQNDVTILAADEETGNSGELENTGILTANGEFLNDGTITDNENAPSGELNINGGGESNGAITQSIINVTGPTEGDDITPFDNNNLMTATDEFNNSGITNNNNQIVVHNADGDAVLTNSGIINANPDSVIHADILANHVVDDTVDPPVTTEGTINMTNATVAVYYQSDDIQGIINVKENPDDAEDSVSELAIASLDPDAPAEFIGDLNVGGVDDAGQDIGNAELDFTSGVIGEAADVAIASGSILAVDGSNSILGPNVAQTPTLTLDGNGGDDYSGDLLLAEGGEVTLKDMNEENGSALYVGAESTTEGGTNPYFEQTGGQLNLVNTEMTMEDSSLIADAGENTYSGMNVDSDSVFNSESGAFTVDDLQNAGLINGINEDYEDYTANDNLIAGDGAGDTQGDFAIDIYGRSNNNSNNDTFGSDDALITSAIDQATGDKVEDGIFNIDDFTLNGDIFGYDAPIDGKIDLGQVFKGEVDETVNIQFTATDKQVLTPIGWYGLTPTGAGNYSFDLKRFNPTAFRGQVTKIAQYQNQLAIDDMLFNHTMLDQGFKGNDYIASNPNRLASANDLYPPYQYSRKDGGLWVKMYGTFEKLNMNHGLHVGNNSYGTILGADFGMKDLRHGWQFMPTAYIAYNGAHQYWNRTGAYQNGAQLGVMGTWYKDNFMIGALAFGGVYNNDMSTPRGSDDTFNYFAGGSVKAAYNWRFAKDWALQPNLLVAYSFFGQENWHTDFGQMGMMSGMLNGVNVAPGLNLIWEKETFSTYATIQYMYNVNQSVGGRAGNVYLPHVHMDRGYIQYGLGINKKFTDRFSGYFQTVLRNVGRTGVGLQLGFNWQFGKGGNNSNMRGYTPELKKTAIKLNGNRY